MARCELCYRNNGVYIVSEVIREDGRGRRVYRRLKTSGSPFLRRMPRKGLPRARAVTFSAGSRVQTRDLPQRKTVRQRPSPKAVTSLRPQNASFLGTYVNR